MECTLFTLLACFSWSNLYLDTGISFADHGDQLYYRHVDTFRIERNSVIETGGTDVTYVYDLHDNPYGRFALGYQLDFGAVSLRLEAEHVSSIQDNDRGTNRISINARWFPFRD